MVADNEGPDERLEAMATDTTYQGWKNYETWCCALWIDNEQGIQEQAHDIARECAALTGDEMRAECSLLGDYWDNPKNVEAGRVKRCADRLKEMMNDITDTHLEESGATGSFIADMLGAAMDSIDWREVAQHYLVDCVEVQS